MNAEIKKDEKFDIIDSHFHLGKYISSSFGNRENDDFYINSVKKLGYKKIIFIHTGLFFDLDFGLTETIKFAGKYKGFAFGLLVYNPNHIEKSIKMIGEHYGKNNIVGIKMHPEDHQCYVTDNRYEPLWKLAQEKDIPILSHTWNPNVPSKYQKFADALLFENIISKYPKLRIILGHSGAKDHYYIQVIKMLKRHPDKALFLDIAGDVLYRDMLETMVDEVGSEKILFGTDIPWMDPLLTISYVRDSEIGTEHKKNIFYNNTRRIFNL
jgi:predicted TIM-barrel fold metal-dependent hydrolase